MNKKVKIICIIIVGIIVVILFLLGILNDVKEEEIFVDNQDREILQGLNLVDNHTVYQSILQVIVKLHINMYDYEDLNKYKNQLDETYKNENNIDENFVKNKEYFEYLSNFEYDVEEMYTQVNNDNSIYLVTGVFKFDETEEDFEESFLVIVDSKTNCYSVKPITSKEYEEYIENGIEVESVNINANSDNKYVVTEFSDRSIINIYLLEIKETLKENSRDIYDILDEEYRNVKFSSVSDFNTYVEENKLNMFSMVEYKKVQYDEYTQYIAINSIGKTWIINETTIGNYTILLDDYTINQPDFINRYNSTDEEEKIMLNIGKVVSAINTNDYRYVYYQMNETYRNNKFSDYETFKKFIDSNFGDNNEIVSVDLEKDSDLYIAEIVMKNGEVKTLYMRLLDGMEYEISFNI